MSLDIILESSDMFGNMKKGEEKESGEGEREET
jgi:hypothetical protein